MLNTIIQFCRKNPGPTIIYVGYGVMAGAFIFQAFTTGGVLVGITATGVFGMGAGVLVAAHTS